jgi:hypothetical protein
LAYAEAARDAAQQKIWTFCEAVKLETSVSPFNRAETDANIHKTGDSAPEKPVGG